MAKAKKKRNKKYQGADAASSRPNIVRVQAISRTPLRQWLYERQKTIKAIGIGITILIVIVVIISGIASLL